MGVGGGEGGGVRGGEGADRSDQQYVPNYYYTIIIIINIAIQVSRGRNEIFSYISLIFVIERNNMKSLSYQNKNDSAKLVPIGIPKICLQSLFKSNSPKR